MLLVNLQNKIFQKTPLAEINSFLIINLDKSKFIIRFV